MEHLTAVSDSTRWVGFAYHVFDSIWGTVGVAIAGLVSGWLLLNKPKFMQKPPEPPAQ